MLLKIDCLKLIFQVTYAIFAFCSRGIPHQIGTCLKPTFSDFNEI